MASEPRAEQAGQQAAAQQAAGQLAEGQQAAVEVEGYELRWFQHRGCVGAVASEQNTVRGALAALERFGGDPTFAGLEFDVAWDPGPSEWLVCHDLPADDAARRALPTLSDYLGAIAAALQRLDKRLQLEVKGDVGDWTQLDATIHGLQLQSRVRVTSFWFDALRGVAAAQSSPYPLGFFVSDAESEALTAPEAEAEGGSGTASALRRLATLRPAVASLWLRVHTFKAGWATPEAFDCVERRADAAGLAPCIFSGIGRVHGRVISGVRQRLVADRQAAGAHFTPSQRRAFREIEVCVDSLEAEWLG